MGAWSVCDPAEQATVSNADVINDLSLGTGRWLVFAYAAGYKISLENGSRTVVRYGINPSTIVDGSVVVRMYNRSGSSITRYNDRSNYYILAARLRW